MIVIIIMSSSMIMFIKMSIGVIIIMFLLFVLSIKLWIALLSLILRQFYHHAFKSSRSFKHCKHWDIIIMIHLFVERMVFSWVNTVTFSSMSFPSKETKDQRHLWNKLEKKIEGIIFQKHIQLNLLWLTSSQAVILATPPRLAIAMERSDKL